MQQRKVLFIYGPTASGKTDLVSFVAKHLSIEVINMDSVQMYTPLTIGTAKPVWQVTDYHQHMFDCINEPNNVTIYSYRERAMRLIAEISDRGNIPVFVGGSGFYASYMLFPSPLSITSTESVSKIVDNLHDKDLWEHLHAIDPDRAQLIHPHDIYRLRRALEIWYTTGKKPSLYKQRFDAPAPFVFLYVTRDRSELYDRINKRVKIMLKQGWIAEVEALIGTPWEYFIQQKGIISYNDVIDYLYHLKSFDELVASIQQHTRHYAKRQETFWRMLRRLLENEAHKNAHYSGSIIELNLAYSDLDLYIKQLLINFCV